MCFSATASFVAGGTLTILGVASLTKAEKKSAIPFAVIPLLFGIQQIAEGILWLSLLQEAQGVTKAMGYIFTGFSRVLWPIYLPLAVLALETVHWRKKVILIFSVFGFGAGLYLLYFMIADGIFVEAIGHHIVYASAHVNPFVTLVFYVLATCVSCFFSSHNYIKIFGGLCLVGLAAAYTISEAAAFSIWCFFAGIISLYILFHFQFKKRYPMCD